MHKGLKPRSMSETSHLPTDVESSGQDPSLHYILSTRPSPPPPLLASPSPPRRPPRLPRSRPRSRSTNVDLCPESRNAIRRSPHLPAPRPPQDFASNLSTPVPLPRPLRGRGIKIPLLRRSLLPAVDNGDSGARMIGEHFDFLFNRGCWACPKFISHF